MASENRVYFRANFYSTDEGTGIGIERYTLDRPVTITYIASIYLEKEMTVREACGYIVNKVKELIAEGEIAVLRLPCNYRNLVSGVKCRKVEEQKKLTECEILSGDALARKTTIEEDLT
jgi:hypothetical protein